MFFCDCYETPIETLPEVIDFHTVTPQACIERALALWRTDPTRYEEYANMVALTLLGQDEQPYRKAGGALLSTLVTELSAIATYNAAFVTLNLIPATKRNWVQHVQVMEAVHAMAGGNQRLRAMAVLSLANAAYHAARQPGDLATALALYEEAAALGNADAAFAASVFYSGAEPTWTGRPDHIKASQLNRMAADAGHAGTSVNLALSHVCGTIEGADRAYGERLLRMHAAEGFLATDVLVQPLGHGRVGGNASYASYYPKAAS